MAINPNLFHQFAGNDDGDDHRGTTTDTNSSDIIADDENLWSSMHHDEYHSDADPVIPNAPTEEHCNETLDSEEDHIIRSSELYPRHGPCNIPIGVAETLNSPIGSGGSQPPEIALNSHMEGARDCRNSPQETAPFQWNINSSESSLKRRHREITSDFDRIQPSLESSGGHPGCHRGDSVEYSGRGDSSLTESSGSPDNNFRRRMISSYRTISMLKGIRFNGPHHDQHKLFPLRKESLVLLEEASKAVAMITSDANYFQHDLKCYPKRKAMRHCKKKGYIIKHMHKKYNEHYWMMMNMGSLYKQLDSLRKQLPPQAIKITTEISPLPRECIITNTLDYLEVLGRDIRALKERIKQINQSVASMVKPPNLSKNLEVHVTFTSCGKLQLRATCAKRRGLIGDLILALETLDVVFEYANIASHDSVITLEALITKDNVDVIDEETIREAILTTFHSIGMD